MSIQDSAAAGAAVEIIPMPAYVEQVSHLMPSLSSFQWWLRDNRPRAVEAGALLLVRGRYYVNPAKMTACIAEAGQEAARRHLAGA